MPAPAVNARSSARRRRSPNTWRGGVLAYCTDGFLIQPAHLPGGLDDFVDLVIPELQERGLFRTEYEGTTLRENLGLDRPASRYADAADQLVADPTLLAQPLPGSR